MLPVVHGREYTQASVFAYTVGLAVVTLMPFLIGMSGWLYLVVSSILNAIFIAYSWRVWRNFSDRVAQKTFRYSINYLSLLFAVLLVDHYFA
jgi:protoheme IX farnesyltransferase